MAPGQKTEGPEGAHWKTGWSFFFFFFFFFQAKVYSADRKYLPARASIWHGTPNSNTDWSEIRDLRCPDFGIAMFFSHVFVNSGLLVLTSTGTGNLYPYIDNRSLILSWRISHHTEVNYLNYSKWSKDERERKNAHYSLVSYNEKYRKSVVSRMKIGL